LRLRAMMARQGRRGAFAIIALIALAVLALAEVTGWLALRLRFESIPSTLILLGANLIIAAVFGWMAARSSPGQTEQEALQVRRQALDEARGTLALAVAVPAIMHLFPGRTERPTRKRGRLPFM
jgi:hypothetical protein